MCVKQDRLILITEILCKNKRKNLIKTKGKKVTNITMIDENYFLVATNDSRMRIININTLK